MNDNQHIHVTRTTLKQFLELLSKTAQQQAKEYTEEKEQLIGKAH